MKKTIVPFDDYNSRIHPNADVIGTVLPTWGNFALTNGWKIIEIYEDKVQAAKAEDNGNMGGISI